MTDRITQLNSGDDSLPVRALRRIRQWIEEHFVSISEAARTIELSKYKLGRILRGQTKITLEILEDLCQRLGVAVEYFVSVDETSGAEIALRRCRIRTTGAGTAPR